MNCENCGMPEGATADKGMRFSVKRRAENNYKRDSKAVVWACSKECAIQALGISEYGIATCKWPITLAQYRATRPLKGIE